MVRKPAVGKRYHRLSLRQAFSDLLDPDPKVRYLSLRFLRKTCDESILPHVADAAMDEDKKVRSLAIRIISQFKEKSLVPLLRKALEDSDEDVVMAALRGLYQMEEIDSSELEKFLRSNSPLVRRRAATYLGWGQAYNTMSLISELLHDEDRGVRKVALWLVANSSEDKAIPHLIGALEDPEEVVRDMALSHLRRIVGVIDLEAGTRTRTIEREIRKWKIWWQREDEAADDRRT